MCLTVKEGPEVHPLSPPLFKLHLVPVKSHAGMDKGKKIQENLFNSLKALRDEVTELYLPKEIPVLREVPRPLDFYRNWVAPNIPLLIKGGVKHWPAIKKWNESYFCEILGKKEIFVTATPNGYADAITETMVDGEPVESFVLPEERLMTISGFYKKLNSALGPSDNSKEQKEGVYYIQSQNSNLTEEFRELLPDIDPDLPWASDTFHSKPSATNLWIGDARAITSLHKDPFENIYCVVSGSKEFILLPPTDRPWLQHKTVPVGKYRETSSGVFDIIPYESSKWVTKDIESLPINCNTYALENKVPRVAVDPCNPDYNKYPLYKYASPLKVRLEEGDVLYLPSLWFHHVKQSHKCIAVNYWYDMIFDIKYAYYQLLENITKLVDDAKQ